MRSRSRAHLVGIDCEFTRIGLGARPPEDLKHVRLARDQPLLVRQLTKHLRLGSCGDAGGDDAPTAGKPKLKRDAGREGGGGGAGGGGVDVAVVAACALRYELHLGLLTAALVRDTQLALGHTLTREDGEGG